LAQLGDALINFIYSAARSRVLKKPSGVKVPDRVLSKALLMASPEKAPRRLGLGGRGDLVEAEIAEAWLDGRITVDEAIDLVARHLKPEDFYTRRGEGEAAAKAIAALLVEVRRRADEGRD